MNGDDDPVELPIDGTLDLHAFSPRDAASVVEEYLYQCRERGLVEVRIIHGRGKGVQRAMVRRLLRTIPGVLDVENAPPGAGGFGATLVRLQKKSPG